MTKIWNGKDVVDALNEKLHQTVSELKEAGVHPTIGILRVAEDPSAVAYEKGATKRAEKIGINVKSISLPQETGEADVLAMIEMLNVDDAVHGVLIFSPLPEHIDEKRVREMLTPEKDVDGITSGSMAGVYMGEKRGYPPCTAQACMEMLDYYGVDPEGKRVAVIGRSLVVGRPVSMMLMKANATVTICHTKTKNMWEVARRADILVVAAGKAKAIGEAYFREDQIVIDVGINMDEDGTMCGDTDFDAAMGKVAAITPVPGGVGSVTTSILMKHVVEAALRKKDKGI